MAASPTDYYAILGLDRRCTPPQIQIAYRNLAQEFHPDRNASAAAENKIREINEAYEVLSDRARRAAYDTELSLTNRSAGKRKPLVQEARLPIRAFFRGATIDVRIHDPSNGSAAETYQLDVPPGTAPGSRLKITRDNNNGTATVRLKVQSGSRFKARGSDLRCDLRISADQALRGGHETIPGADDRPVVITIPPRVASGEILRLRGHGLPNSRGSRGDLLVRIVYRPRVQISHRTR